MPQVRLSPLFNDQATTVNGAPATGYKIYTYAAGSSTPLATYTNSTGTIAQTNPVILDSNGFPTGGQIWLQSGNAYKLVLTDASGAVIRTNDNVSGVNDTTTSVSQWSSSGVNPTYISASSFSLIGDQTSEFHVGRRLQFTTTAGTVYGTIVTSAYTTLTTVTMTMDSGNSLDSGLSVVNLSILRADYPALPKTTYNVGVLNENRGADIASAATINLTTATGNVVDVTGTTTITAITLADGAERTVRFTGVLTLTNGASLVLPGAANITTAAGDYAVFRGYAAGVVRCTSYSRLNGTPVVQIPSATTVASTSGTSIDFTGIPTGIKRVTVVLSGTSTNGTSSYIVQLGTSSGFDTSGYVGRAESQDGTTLTSDLTSGFMVVVSPTAISAWRGHLTLTNIGGNAWIGTSQMAAIGTQIRHCSGDKTLAGTLDRIRITTVAGVDTFDAGSINILYE